MIITGQFINGFARIFPLQQNAQPWLITNNLPALLLQLMAGLGCGYEIKDGIAIHNTAVIETGVILKAPVIISEDCFVGAYSFLRGGVYLAAAAKIGPGCEIKTSILFNNSAAAHFNFIGDSIIGNNVNFEAGAISANHYNEREDKSISVFYNKKIIVTGANKFGALVGDNSKIGANAVLSPGTILNANSIVKRLELIDQAAGAV